MEKTDKLIIVNEPDWIGKIILGAFAAGAFIVFTADAKTRADGHAHCSIFLVTFFIFMVLLFKTTGDATIVFNEKRLLYRFWHFRWEMAVSDIQSVSYTVKEYSTSTRPAQYYVELKIIGSIGGSVTEKRIEGRVAPGRLGIGTPKETAGLSIMDVYDRIAELRPEAALGCEKWESK